MCTTWSTRNRANVFNKYSVQTLLVDRTGYCPCGPNHPDYSYRSRLYNPDPKYQGLLDHTCHMYDSIPKDTSCGGYGRPILAPGYNYGNKLPCFAAPNTGCWPEKEFEDIWCPLPPTRCKRRQIRPPTMACCKPKTSMKQWIKFVKECKRTQKEASQRRKSNICCENPIPPVCFDEEDVCDDRNAQQLQESEGGYSLEVPRAKNFCGSKVTYNCSGQSGNCCLRAESGEQETTKMCPGDGYIMVETDACGGMSTQCIEGRTRQNC